MHVQAILQEEPWTRFASTVDLGGPGGSIHPHRKLEIGRRAAAELVAMDHYIYNAQAGDTVTPTTLQTLSPRPSAAQAPRVSYDAITPAIEVKLWFDNDEADCADAAAAIAGIASHGNIRGAAVVRFESRSDVVVTYAASFVSSRNLDSVAMFVPAFHDEFLRSFLNASTRLLVDLQAANGALHAHDTAGCADGNSDRCCPVRDRRPLAALVVLPERSFAGVRAWK